MIPALRMRRIIGHVGSFGGYSKAILGLSPIAYWPLSDASGTAAVDVVAGNNGTYTGVDLGQSQAPFTCPFFDGANDRVNIYSAGLNTLYNRSEGSLSIWSKVYDAGVWTDATNRFIFNMTTTSTADLVKFQRTITNGVMTGQVTLDGTTSARNSTSNSSTAWIHWAVTWSKAADQVIVYKNGAQVGATLTSLGTPSGNALLNTSCAIGSSAGTSSAAVWNGWIAHAALWSRPLTPTEVANLYTWGLS